MIPSRTLIPKLFGKLARTAHRSWPPALVAAIVAVALLSPSPAFALSGIYAQIGGGYGKYGGSELILQKTQDGGDVPLTGDACCAAGGPAFQLRLGYSIFGADGRYHEIPERPCSTENPDEERTPFTDKALEFLETIVSFAGGERFF